MMHNAGYRLKYGHGVAMQKEKRDLERKGLLKDYLAWIKAEYPSVYKERKKAWKIKG